MGDVADVSIKSTPNQIRHENVSRDISIGANVKKGADLGQVATAIQARLGKVSFPTGTHAELLGEFAERQATTHRLAGFGILAAIGVFLLLVAAFRNWRLGLLSFVVLPSALVGGVLAAYFFTGGVVSLGALVGFFTVLGIAARNGIMLINHYQHLERYGPGARSPRDRRHDSRPRDRAPHGGGHPGRPGDVHDAEPVRAALPVPQVRAGAPGQERPVGGTRRSGRLTAGVQPAFSAGQASFA
jgi:hypothetical protein